MLFRVSNSSHGQQTGVSFDVAANAEALEYICRNLIMGIVLHVCREKMGIVLDLDFW